jgi:hypothetical protein
MGCAGSKSEGEVLATAPVAIAGGDTGNLGIRDPPSSTPVLEQASDNGPGIATLMQQNQEMMRLFLLSQANTAAPVADAPYDGGGWGSGGGEVDGGKEGAPFARATTRTVLPSSLTVIGFSVEDDLLGSDSCLEEKAVVSALDAVFYAES